MERSVTYYISSGSDVSICKHISHHFMNKHLNSQGFHRFFCFFLAFLKTYSYLCSRNFEKGALFEIAPAKHFGSFVIKDCPMV